MMMKRECRIPTRSFPLLVILDFCYFSHFMPSPEELARDKIDIKHLQWSSRGRCDMDHRPEGFTSRRASDQSAQLDRVSRVCVSTIQRLYSMLRPLLSWIETPTPQHQITRGDRQRFVRVQRACSVK